MIPKKIHYIWLGGKDEPEILKKCKRSWKKYCPDYEIIRWDETNLDLDKFQFAKSAYEDKKYAFASDVFRFDILNNEGGIYLDVDVELIGPLDKFLKHDLFMGFESETQVAPGLIIGSIKGQEHLIELIKVYEELEYDSTKLKSLAIPIITTNYLKEKIKLKTNNSTQFFNDEKIAIYSTEYFCPKSVSDGKVRKTKNTVSIHWYNMSWYTPLQRFKHNCKVALNVLSFGLFEKILRKIRNKENS